MAAGACCLAEAPGPGRTGTEETLRDRPDAHSTSRCGPRTTSSATSTAAGSRRTEIPRRPRPVRLVRPAPGQERGRPPRHHRGSREGGQPGRFRAPQDRRPVRQLHGRRPRRPARPRADQGRPRADRRDPGQGRPDPHRGRPPDARASAVSSACFVTTDAKQSDRYIAQPEPGRHQPARRVVLSRRQVQAHPREVRRPRREDVRAGRHRRSEGRPPRGSWPSRPRWPSTTGTASRTATAPSPTTRRTARHSSLTPGLRLDGLARSLRAPRAIDEVIVRQPDFFTAHGRDARPGLRSTTGRPG